MGKGKRIIIFGVLLLAIIAAGNADSGFSLKLSSFTPPNHPMNTLVFEPWMKTISEQTGGRVKISLYAGSVLGKPQDQYDMVVNGVCELSWGILGYTPGRFPLTSVMELPFMSPSAETGSRIVQRLYDGGHLKAEYEDVKLLALGLPTGIDLHTRDKQVRTLEDIKGMRIRVFSPVMGKIVKVWGGVPVAMPASEVYLAMSRGVLDAVMMDVLTLTATKLDEVTNFHTRINISSSPFFFAMNKKTWEKLPADIQAMFQRQSGEYFSADLNGKMIDNLNLKTWKMLESRGHTVIDLKPAELERWREASVFALDEWRQEMDAAGAPGTEILRETQKLKTAFDAPR
jgi:TRAP-type C4-dicarboxylate transport system substrate-binding protein